ncbi:BMC domain-containing protein [Escherichia coli]|uniref:Microcompartment protein n=1 Tax=Escherichia coli TaxID=562 RepID=A0AAP7PDT1_ECOLX|nr:BMC domain-containing protein [Escherichia coli]EEZ0359768.1 BMC domain-containing protein [Escherichia coli]EFL1981390.1 BMC domain-containing protein [Escherichia coli]EHC4142083.1 BMC domain-containing protein [Escherichia coli]EHE2559206.1 BMC domain-containing protein [Escherichia coli]EIH4170065.1 BMC domain-containing protein [Escherichia coli]
MKQSLGLLEVSGLALAISCADVMAKAASITLIGLEKTHGSGWTVIKITGDVASVQSAIITGASFAERRNGLVANKVIARPAGGILAHVESDEPASVPEIIIEERERFIETPESQDESETVLVSCNLCLDPACRRQKGEPHSQCLHSGKRGEK